MWNKKLGLLTVVLMIVMATGCSKVPDLTGMTKDQAQDALAKKKLVLGTVTTTNVAGKPPGTVVDQDPKPKEKIPDNKTVALVLQAGDATAGGTTGGATGGTGGTTGGTGTTNPNLVSVPNLTGKTPADASVLLVQNGLVLADSPKVEINDKPPGLIFAQDPPAGTQVALATHVAVSVASDAIVTVPSVIGHPQAEAQQLITAAQLTPTVETDMHPGSDAIGSVFEQSPPASMKVVKGQTVLLKVKQDSVTVPNVVGQTQEQAQLHLFQGGLTPVTQLVPPSPNNLNIVINQSQPVNTVVPRGTTVTIYVGGLRRINPIFVYKNYKLQ
jgi:eukaryotic-like serine/threonine-protein kinase